ncbi:hypothetical protein A8709_28560 [Paenibacillus pectinilyticus]|uniref:DNA-binding response regulator n=2 Tax=Paenibacillus pectinilyticus TaxID=512399 RepID=A0A1C0ZUN7_9BACL|nr:hypothetical protein A8709_28560 [Paenibacillus pectinilyticus]
MLRILVVDDELPIRQGLSFIISDLDPSYEIIGEAANGYEALLLIEETKPDLVITDIKMPKMDGVKLVKRMSEWFPEIKKVVLSGFDEFEFVREVMKEGVLDYLLKPVVESQLHELLIKIDRDLEAEKQSKLDSLSMNMKFNESMPLLRDQFLQQLICSGKRLARRDAGEKLDYYNIEVMDGMYAVSLVQLDNHRYLQMSLGTEQLKINQFIVKNIAQESAALHAQCHSFYQDTILVLVYNVKDQASLEHIQSSIASDIFRNLKTYTKLRFSISSGRAVAQFQDLNESYESAVSQLGYRFYRSNSSIIDGNAKLPRFLEASFPKVTSELQKGWLDSLSTGDTRKLKGAFANYCQYHVNQFTQPSLVILELSNTFLSLQSDNVRFKEALIDCFGVAFSFVKFLDQFDTLDEIRLHTINLFSEVIQHMQVIDQKREKKSIQQVKSYIIENYREEITLGKMADLVFMNANYLSELFKIQCNINFIDYVTQVRIDKAKSLLKNSSYRTYEVGELVGYDDPAYFSKVFKKMIGVSPSEYRNLIE